MDTHAKLWLAVALSGVLAGCASRSATEGSGQEGWALSSHVASSATSGLTVWRVNFSWQCNADGGGFGITCLDTRVVPDPRSNSLPADLIHCKTTYTLIKRDPGTTAGWSTARTDSDMIIFRHDIRAESEFFGAGREIHVVYEHVLVFRSDRDAAAALLGCTFTINERI